VDLIKFLEDRTSFDLNILYEIWRTRNFDLWSCSPELYRKFGERFLEVGEPLMAYDVVIEGLKCFIFENTKYRASPQVFFISGAYDELAIISAIEPRKFCTKRVISFSVSLLNLTTSAKRIAIICVENSFDNSVLLSCD
ncbi:unnamed protein product, partial [marine sediment metagenome]